MIILDIFSIPSPENPQKKGIIRLFFGERERDLAIKAS